jgi:ParB family chromosome partitioning protein
MTSIHHGWSLDEIAPEARRAAERAAEAAGMPLEIWLNQLIKYVSAMELSGQGPARARAIDETIKRAAAEQAKVGAFDGPAAGALDAPTMLETDEPELPTTLPAEVLSPNRFAEEQPGERDVDQAIGEWRKSGALPPLLVRPDSRNPGHYEIVNGMERWHAANRLHMKRIPVTVKHLTDEEVLRATLIQKLARQSLPPLDEAQIYQRLMEETGLSVAALSDVIGRSPTHVATAMQLLDLPQPVREQINSGELTVLHARTLLGAADPESAAREVVARRLDIYQTEQLVRASHGALTPPQPAAPEANVSEAEIAEAAIAEIAPPEIARPGTVTPGTGARETDTPETDAPETDAPASDSAASDIAASDTPETDIATPPPDAAAEEPQFDVMTEAPSAVAAAEEPPMSAEFSTDAAADAQAPLTLGAEQTAAAATADEAGAPQPLTLSPAQPEAEESVAPSEAGPQSGDAPVAQDAPPPLAAAAAAVVTAQPEPGEPEPQHPVATAPDEIAAAPDERPAGNASDDGPEGAAQHEGSEGDARHQGREDGEGGGDSTRMVETHLSTLLGLKVSIAERNQDDGVLSIHYNSENELTDLVSRLNRMPTGRRAE